MMMASEKETAMEIGDKCDEVIHEDDTIKKKPRERIDWKARVGTRAASTRTRKVPAAFSAHAGTGTLTVPTTVIEALKDEEWFQAVKREMDGHVEAGTYRIVDIPNGRRLIDTTIKFTVKRDGRKKARWCVRGDRQVAGVDYGATDSPVLRFDTMMVLLWIAANTGATVHTLDATMTFVKADTDRPVLLKGLKGRHELE
jgi:hypothetical protein